jgi:hypothetical protein
LSLFAGFDDVDNEDPEAAGWERMISPADFPCRVPGRIDPSVKFFVEAILQAPHPTTLGYRSVEDRVEPVLGPNPGEREQLTRFQDAAVEFARQVLDLRPGLLDDADITRLMIPFLRRFAQRPEREEAIAWGDIEVESEGTGLVPLASPLRLQDLTRLRHGRSALARHAQEWPAGRRARSSRLMRWILCWIGFA